jgi:small-conductance mechanosensitive channel
MHLDELHEAVSEWLDGTGLSGAVLSILIAVLATLALVLILRLKRALMSRLSRAFEGWSGTRIRPLFVQDQEIISADDTVRILTGLLRAVSLVMTLVLLFAYATLVTWLFPATEPLAVAVLGYAVSAVQALLLGIVGYLPRLIEIAIIVTAAHYLIRLAKLIFDGIESERIKLRRFYPDWAEPTFRIVRVLLIALAAVAVIPLLPGASSPAFKGISIFLGALVSLGSTGVVANVVAGTVSTYMRAFQAGDRVRIADTEGTVIKRSVFVTKIMTPKNAIISVPNAMVLANHIINYSELAKNRGLILPTTVTIGYDVPWRRVHDLLIEAAKRTENVEDQPEPFVLQTSLDDFYVSYELNVYTSSPAKMAATYSELHQNIQDAFNEAGVEIMSPHFAALRDGNRMAVPDDHLPKNYETPAIRIHPLEKLLPRRDEG